MYDFDKNVFGYNENLLIFNYFTGKKQFVEPRRKMLHCEMLKVLNTCNDKFSVYLNIFSLLQSTGNQRQR